MIKELDGYDWEKAFDEAVKVIEPAPPTSQVSLGPYTRDDVVHVVAMVDGENDGDEWIGVFQLADGRWICVEAGCDYTGWE